MKSDRVYTNFFRDMPPDNGRVARPPHGNRCWSCSEGNVTLRLWYGRLYCANCIYMGRDHASRMTQQQTEVQ